MGKSRSGKSYWTKGYLRAIPKGRTVIVWDPQGEYGGPGARDMPAGWGKIFPGVLELARWARESPGDVAGARIVVQSPRKSDFPLLCRAVYNAGNCTFVVDEASLVCRASQPKDQVADLLYLVAVSRHRGVDLVFISQRPSHLAPDIRDAQTRTLLFHMTGEASLGWVRNEISKEAAEALRNLPQGAYLEA